jgi:very-short-patch-repair endonuclease
MFLIYRPWMARVLRKTSPHAARLRKKPTDVERKIWQAFRSRQLEGFKFRRQASADPFVVDFLRVEAQLVVELDGSQHSVVMDARRTRFLNRRGLEVIRFWNNEVIENLDGVAETILQALLRRVAELANDPDPKRAAKAIALSRLRERVG